MLLTSVGWLPSGHPALFNTPLRWCFGSMPCVLHRQKAAKNLNYLTIGGHLAAVEQFCLRAV
jgi:hypothetical protein